MSWPTLSPSCPRAIPPARHPAEPVSGCRQSPREVRLDGPLLDVEQAAALLNVKPSMLYEWVRTREVPCLRLGPACDQVHAGRAALDSPDGVVP